MALSEIKDWNYNSRFLCIQDDQCAVGTVISEPTAAFDGDRKQIVIGLVDTLLLPTNVGTDGNPKGFQSRFLREELAGSPDQATRDAIEQDTDPGVNWQSPNAKSTVALNPMFRFENEHTVPYLHCEIEGNYIAVLLDGFIEAPIGIRQGRCKCCWTTHWRAEPPSPRRRMRNPPPSRHALTTMT